MTDENAKFQLEFHENKDVLFFLPKLMDPLKYIYGRLVDLRLRTLALESTWSVTCNKLIIAIEIMYF